MLFRSKPLVTTTAPPPAPICPGCVEAKKRLQLGHRLVMTTCDQCHRQHFKDKADAS